MTTYDDIIEQHNIIPVRIEWNKPFPYQEILYMYKETNLFAALNSLFEKVHELGDVIIPNGFITTQEVLNNIGYIAKDFGLLLSTISKDMNHTDLFFSEYMDTATWMETWKPVLTRKQFFDMIQTYRGNAKISRLHTLSKMYHLQNPTLRSGIVSNSVPLNENTILTYYTSDYDKPITEVISIEDDGLIKYRNHKVTYYPDDLYPIELVIDGDENIYHGVTFNNIFSAEVKERIKENLKTSFTYRLGMSEYWIDFVKKSCGVDTLNKGREYKAIIREDFQPAQIVYETNYRLNTGIKVKVFVFSNGVIWIPEMYKVLSIPSSGSPYACCNMAMFTLSKPNKYFVFSDNPNKKNIEIIRESEMNWVVAEILRNQF